MLGTIAGRNLLLSTFDLNHRRAGSRLGAGADGLHDWHGVAHVGYNCLVHGDWYGDQLPGDWEC